MNIAIMGVTGAGKSTFVKAASELPTVGIGHDLHSFTETVDSYTFEYRDMDITLIDTPGFNDTELNESDVLKAIADWLDFNYRNDRQKLNGIIYLQSIMDPRMTGSSLRNLKMFKDLCGLDPLRNVLLVTTRWGMAAKANEQALAESREEQYAANPMYWAKMIEAGARMDRFEDTQESAMRILMRLRHSDPVPLQIQSEMVDQDKQLAQTSAGITVNEEIIALEQKYKHEMAELQKEMEDARKDQDKRLEDALADARQEARDKLERVYQQQDALHYERRAADRRLEDEMEDLRDVNKKLMKFLEQNGARDFDETVAKLEANGGKLRREQREAVQREINVLKKKPKRQRTVIKLMLAILPVLGSVAFALIGIPIAPGVFGGLLGSFMGGNQDDTADGNGDTAAVDAGGE